jgi:hypothetical protein
MSRGPAGVSAAGADEVRLRGARLAAASEGAFTAAAGDFGAATLLFGSAFGALLTGGAAFDDFFVADCAGAFAAGATLAVGVSAGSSGGAAAAGFGFGVLRAGALALFAAFTGVSGAGAG